jgi:probable HAF family extracellular repeat protein
MAKFSWAVPAGLGLVLAIIGSPANAGNFVTIAAAQDGFLSSLSRDGHIAAGAYVTGGTYAGSWIWRTDAGGYNTPLNVAAGMNAWAQPVVGSADNGSGFQVAAVGYSDIDTAGPVVLGPYPGSQPLDSFYSQAYGVSDDGTVVGLAMDAYLNAIAFRWTSAQGFSRLPVPRPNDYSRANGISGDGNVIYGWNDHDDGYRSGLIWIDGTPVEPHNHGLYGDAFGSPPGEALGGNRDGSVIVGLGYWDDLLQSEAWRWTQATDAQPLGLVIPPGTTQYLSLQTRYKAPGGLSRIASIGAPDDWGDMPQSLAAAVSEDGNTVVGYTGTPYNQDAFIWTPSSGMVLLADYAAAHGVVIPAGFLLYGANAISADGQIIGGTGIDPTGTYVVPWILDLHDVPALQARITAVGVITANDLVTGPFAGFPLGTTVTLSFQVSSKGTQISGGHATDYTVRPSSLRIAATYLDTSDYSHLDAVELPGASDQPLLHMLNDAPRSDGLSLDAVDVATPGQQLQFNIANAGGMLFDSDRIVLVNRTFSADAFDTADWSIGDGVNQLTIAPQWVTIEDDSDELFADGFDGN